MTFSIETANGGNSYMIASGGAVSVFWGKQYGYINLPIIPGYKITEIAAKASGNLANGVQCAITDANGIKVCPTADWSKSATVTYAIPENYRSCQLRLVQMASNKNAQLDKITYTIEPEVNAAPTINIQPVGATYYVGDDAEPLTVTATGYPVPTYQWYQNSTNSIEGATAISDATGTSFTPSTDTEGTTYYYCVAKNEFDDAEHTATSNIVKVEVIAGLPCVNFVANTDKGSSNGTGADSMEKGGITISSTNAAFATADYRFYANSTTTISSTTLWITKIVFIGNNSSNPLSNLSVNGNNGTYNTTTYVWEGRSQSVAFTASAQARATEIKVYYEIPENAAPEFSTQPVGATYFVGDEATALTVAATGYPAPTYQWYSNTINSTVGANAIEGATNTSYTPSTAAAGTTYYYCMATNNYDNVDHSVTSDIVAIEVNAVPTCEITWSVNGSAMTGLDESITTQQCGADLVLPAADPTIEGYVFMGWTSDATVTDADFTKVTTATAVPNDESVTYYAVFAVQHGVGGTKTIDVSTVGFPAAYPNSNYTFDGIEYHITDVAIYNNSGKIQWKKSSGLIYNITELPGLQSIAITYDESESEHNISVYAGTSQNPTSGTEIENPVVSGNTYTFDLSGGDYSYFVMQNGSGVAYVTSIAIVYGSATYSDYATRVKLNPHLSFDAPTYILRDGDNWVMPVATSKNTDVVITYTSENSSVAEIVDNEITFNGYGTTTITATQEKNDTYAAATATCTLQYMPGVTTNAYCWATYAPSNDIMLTDIEVSEGTVDVYYVTALNDENQVTATDVVKEIGEDYAMAASTGVLVKTSIPGAIVTFMPSITNDVKDADLLDNMLVGVLEKTDMSTINNAFILTATENKGIGFYPCKKGTLAANKCYLQLPEGSNAASLSIMLPNGDETAIGSVFGGESNAPAYNLDGRRVNSNYRGIVIINGKKVVNK